MINSNYIMQDYRNYEIFKEALRVLAYNDNLSEDEVDIKYLYLKAQLYNIDVDNFKNNLSGLEQTIRNIESSSRLQESRR
jgi:hypothetical protein